MMLFFASKLFRLSVFTYPAAMPTSWTCILFSDCVCILILRGESFRWKRAIFIPWWRCRNVLFRSHTTLMEMMRMRWGFELQTFPIFLVFNSCEDRAFTFQSVKNVKNWNESSHFHFGKGKVKIPYLHSVWKSSKMSHLNFSILAFSSNFCSVW